MSTGSGYDISASTSADHSGRAATGAIEFGEVDLVGTGNNNFLWLAVAGVAVWFFFLRGK